MIHSDHSPDPHHDLYSKTTFGFWVFLLTDFMLFATLFATYAVLKNSTFGGPSSRGLFSEEHLFFESLALLMASFTSGLAGAYLHRKEKRGVVLFFALTFILGMAFLFLQTSQIIYFLSEGYSWEKSAFLSIFYTLLSTYSLHIIFALLWTIVLLIPAIREEISLAITTRLTCLRMFWQFLGIIWVLMFTIIYLI